MHFQNLALIFALSAIGLAQDIDANDVPGQCTSVCASLVTLTRDCDNSTNDDAAELNCLCNATNASTLIPLCAACISQNGDRDNDAVDILTSCSFTATTYVSSAASSALSSISSQSSQSTQSGSTPATTPATTSAPGTQSLDPTSATQGAQSSFSGGAPVQTVAAAAGLGALGLALML